MLKTIFWSVLVGAAIIYAVGSCAMMNPRPETNSEPVPPRIWHL